MVSIAHTSPFKASYSYPLQQKRRSAGTLWESEELIGRDKRAKFTPHSPSLESFEFLMAKSPAASSASGRMTNITNISHLGPLRRSSEISFAQLQSAVGQEAAEATSRRQDYTEAASDIDLRIREVSFVSIHFPPPTRWPTLIADWWTLLAKKMLC